MLKHSSMALTLLLLLSAQAVFCPKWINGPETNTTTESGSRRTERCKYKLYTFEDTSEITIKQAANIYESLTSNSPEKRARALEKLIKIKANLEMLTFFFEGKRTVPACVLELIERIISTPDYSLSFDELIAVTQQTTRVLDEIEADNEYAFYTTPYETLSSEQLLETVRSPEYRTKISKDLEEKLSEVFRIDFSPAWVDREIDSMIAQLADYKLSIAMSTGTALFITLFILGHCTTAITEDTEDTEHEKAKILSSNIALIKTTYASNSIVMTTYRHPAFNESTGETDRLVIAQASIKMGVIYGIHASAEALMIKQLID